MESLINEPDLEINEMIIICVHLIWTQNPKRTHHINQLFTRINTFHSSISADTDVFFHYLLGKFLINYENNAKDGLHQFIKTKDMLLSSKVQINGLPIFLIACGTLKETDEVSISLSAMCLVIDNEISDCYFRLQFYRIALFGFSDVYSKQKKLYSNDNHLNKHHFHSTENR